MQYLEFKMEKSSYGIEIVNVVEIIENIDVTFVPVSDENVLGITSIRNKVVPVYNLAHKLGLENLGDDSINGKNINQYIVVENNGTSIALRISSAESIRSIADSEVGRLPEGFMPESPIIKGVIKEDNDLISILDVRRFFNEDIDALVKIGA